MMVSLLGECVMNSISWKIVLKKKFINTAGVKSNGKCFSTNRGGSSVFHSSGKTETVEGAIQSVVVCGPSGVGKGTLIARLLKEYPNSFALSVSHTSRKPRPGEIDGVHYHFVEKEAFKNDIECGKYRYVETAEVHGNLYGTREDAVFKIHDENKVCVLDVDTRGVQSLKKMNFPMRSIFVIPPSMSVLEQRLVDRHTETAEVIAIRIHNAKAQMEYGLTPNQFDVILVNDQLDIAYSQFVEILKKWFPLQFKNYSSVSTLH